jgi:hypothetical protein
MKAMADRFMVLLWLLFTANALSAGLTPMARGLTNLNFGNNAL